ncbi:hypothetical protein JJB11_13250 [Ramlibacter ginsenosidimutans]|uniref:Uncharacterized protein n=1 Tax=Ramlibacter ginsenosidimutans TaxID=502333 RepID=A0A934TT37_9BURK|nr:hypothetical protein [Ramlibacter ginsenosidimutans]MBK6007062.1 hypothetical protein [Ramlibacter ginsenosidimutans]
MKHSLHTKVAAAVMVLAPLGLAAVAQPAAAQTFQYHVADSRQGTINGITIDSDSGLRPGSTLRISVHATPGARWANLSLADGVRVPLRERAPGEYVGSYVIRRSDRIDPAGQMQLRAGWGGEPVVMAYNYPAAFQAHSMGAAPATAEVNSFAMWPHDEDRLDPGRVVHFRVEGTPHARAGVRVPGVVDWLQLTEERPGTYVGSYTIRRRDDTDAFRGATAMLRAGDQRVVARLGERGDRDHGDRDAR